MSARKQMCIKCEVRTVSELRLSQGKKLCGNCASQIKTNLKRKSIHRKTKEPVNFKKDCAYCGDEFLGNKKRKYCCLNCSDKANKEQREAYFKSKAYIENRKVQRRTEFVDKRCVICNFRFETNDKSQVCCSDKCRVERQRQKSREYYQKNKGKK